jgi:hypothetical protein
VHLYIPFAKDVGNVICVSHTIATRSKSPVVSPHRKGERTYDGSIRNLL